jgi:putative peptidoglycan lipid II flippase
MWGYGRRRTIVTIDADSSATEAAAHPEVPHRAWLLVDGLRGTIGRGFLPTLALVVGLSLATRAAAAAKDLLVAYQFGISDDLDAFILASLVPTSILYAFAASAGDAFLPLYVAERRVDEASARRFLASATTISAMALMGVAVTLGLGAPWIVPALASGFDRAKADLTLVFYIGLLPTFLTGGVSAVWPAALNAHGRQAVTAAVPLVTPLATVAALGVLAPRVGAVALVTGAVVGAAAEAAILGLALARMRSPIISRRPRLDPVTARFGRNVVPLIAGALISLGSGLVDQGMAASLGPGAVSAFTYASKIFVLLTGLAGIAVTMVVLPYFAQLVSEADGRSLRSSYAFLLALALGAGLALAALLAIGSREIVSALFERGSFGPADTAVVAPPQAILALQLPFALGTILTSRFLIALGSVGALAIAAIISVVLHYVGNLLLIPVIGVSGIALSGTISSTVVFVILTVWALRSVSRA